MAVCNYRDPPIPIASYFVIYLVIDTVVMWWLSVWYECVTMVVRVAVSICRYEYRYPQGAVTVRFYKIYLSTLFLSLWLSSCYEKFLFSYRKIPGDMCVNEVESLLPDSQDCTTPATISTTTPKSTTTITSTSTIAGGFYLRLVNHSDVTTMDKFLLITAMVRLCIMSARY